MTSQPGKQTNTHIAQYLTKGNQIMKFGWLRKYKKRRFFFKHHAENEAGRHAADLFLFFKKVKEVKASGQQVSFNIFRQPST